MLKINGDEVVFSGFFNLQDGGVGSFSIPRIPAVSFHFHTKRKPIDPLNAQSAFTFEAEGNEAHYYLPFFDGQSIHPGLSFEVGKFAVNGNDEYTARVTAQGVGSMMRVHIDVTVKR